MVRIHAGLDLEDESGERSGDVARGALLVLARLGGGGEVDKGVERLVDAEVEHRRGEHHRGRLPREERLLVVVLILHVEKLGFVDGRRPRLPLELGRGLGGEGLLAGDRRAAVGAGVLRVLAGDPVEDAAEVTGLSDGPRDRGGEGGRCAAGPRP